MKTRTLTLTAVALLGSVIVLIGGYWFLGNSSPSSARTGSRPRIQGMELHGDVDDWGWGWEYNFLEVTQPAEADLSVQFGTGPAINIKDLTPALVTRYENETHVGADQRPPDLQIFGAGGSTVFFRGGVVIRAVSRERQNLPGPRQEEVRDAGIEEPVRRHFRQAPVYRHAQVLSVGHRGNASQVAHISAYMESSLNFDESFQQEQAFIEVSVCEGTLGTQRGVGNAVRKHDRPPQF